MKTNTIQSLENYLYSAFNNKRTLWMLATLMILIYMFPIYFFGDRVEVIIYDGLDIVIPLNKMLAHSGMLFADSSAIVPNVLGDGVPRSVLGSEFNIQLLLYYFFDDFTAYTIHETLMHFAGFFSMLVLLSHYFIPPRHLYRNLIIFSVSALYSLVPFYHGAGLSAPLLPLALYAFLQIRSHENSWIEWVILILIPFYSNLILVYTFFIISMGMLFMVDTIRNKKINFPFLYALILLSVVFLGVEYRLVYSMLIDNTFHSHREEFATLHHVKSYFEMYKNAHANFLNGLVNAPSYASIIIIPTMLLALILSVFSRKLSFMVSLLAIIFFVIVFAFNPTLGSFMGSKYFMPVLTALSFFLFIKHKKYRLFYGFILIQILFSFLYASWFLTDVGELIKNIPVVNKYNFARFSFLQPTLWYIILALSFLIFTEKLRWSPLLIISILTIQTITATEIKKFNVPHTLLNYHSFYGSELFEQVKKYIGKPVSSYRVGSVGIFPAITIYNGFYTIDGYLANYPLEYKHKFSKIIQKNISNMKDVKELFSLWGSKCYLFNADNGFINFQSDDKFDDLNLDFDAFYEVGGRYLISSNQLDDKYLDKLVFLKKFTDKNTFWQVYLYEVKSPDDKNESL